MILNFMYFSQKFHGFINIHEYYNMIICIVDHLVNIIMSLHYIKTEFGTLGHIAIEMLLDL